MLLIFNRKGTAYAFVSFSEFVWVCPGRGQGCARTATLTQSSKHSAGGCSQRSDTFLLSCLGCMLPAWTLKKIVWGGTDGCRRGKRGSHGKKRSSWAGSCNPRWDGIILHFHIGCPFVFQGTIWSSKCCLAWVWPCIIWITVIVFYSVQNRDLILNRVYGNVAAICQSGFN